MKFQPTSSSRCSELTPEVKAEMERRGLMPQAWAVPSVPTYSVRIPPRRPPQRELTASEMLRLFDKREALHIVYVPHFITQCIMFYLDELCNYTSANRLSQYKRLRHTLVEIKSEYYYAVRKEMPPRVYDKFMTQRDEYLTACGANLQIMYFTFSNELARKYKNVENDVVVCYALMIVALAQFIEDYDAAVNRRIEEKIKMPTHNHGDARVRRVKEICRGIAGKYALEPTEQTKLALQVIANRAKSMINDMLE